VTGTETEITAGPRRAGRPDRARVQCDRPGSARTVERGARHRPHRARLPRGAPLVCYLGRKSSAKSLDLLLRALPVVKHQPPPILALAGPSTEWFQRVLREAPCPERIRDLPALSEIAKSALLAASDLLVQPSRHEAFGIVFLEAWASRDAGPGCRHPGRARGDR